MACERRIRVRQRIADILDGDTVLAHNIEVATFNHVLESAGHNTGLQPRRWDNPKFARAYTDKARSLIFNLRNTANPALKQDVLSGKVEACHFVKMTPQELFPERWIKLMYEVQLLANKRMAPQLALDVTEGAFTCNRCKSKRTTYFQLQTRSADEPMTTFVTCLDCFKRWKM